jgi:hypothetical protein
VSTLAELGYDYVAWRTKRGWSAAHAVAGADTVGPEDCGGYWTACRVRIPKDALDYTRWPEGTVASRGPYAWVARIHQMDGALCNHCRRLLKKEGER